jgi:hypothetical protein
VGWPAAQDGVMYCEDMLTLLYSLPCSVCKSLVL